MDIRQKIPLERKGQLNSRNGSIIAIAWDHPAAAIIGDLLWVSKMFTEEMDCILDASFCGPRTLHRILYNTEVQNICTASSANKSECVFSERVKDPISNRELIRLWGVPWLTWYIEPTFPDYEVAFIGRHEYGFHDYQDADPNKVAIATVVF